MRHYRIEIKWGILFSLMTLLWMIMERYVGLHDRFIHMHSYYTNFIAIPSILLYFLALLDKRRAYYGGKMSYKKGFYTGLVITLIVTLFAPIVQYVTSIYVTPEFFSNAIKYGVSTGKMSHDEATSYFNLQSYLLQSFVGAPIMGTITSAIVAVFTRKVDE